MSELMYEVAMSVGVVVTFALTYWLSGVFNRQEEQERNERNE
jgi:hypothetical protein